MNKTMKLEECGIEIMSGFIMKRIIANTEAGEEIAESRRVIVPKCITDNGEIDVDSLPEEGLKVKLDNDKLTSTGDIVLKLSTPYDAAIIDKESEGCVIPSFCAIIKNTGNLDPNYLLAFLNSSYCKEQLKAQVAGSIMTVLSVGKIKNVNIPIPDAYEEEVKIGSQYIETRRKTKIINEIIKLEKKRNDIIFKDMVKTNE